jgi:hypothetical protein
LRPSKFDWSDTAGSRGVLLFAQLMTEMLNPATFESFRVYSLDTIARLDEAIQHIWDVEKDRIPKDALKPVM